MRVEMPEVGKGLDAIGLGGFGQGIEIGACPRAGLGVTEEPCFSPYYKWSNRIFGPIVVCAL